MTELHFIVAESPVAVEGLNSPLKKLNPLKMCQGPSRFSADGHFELEVQCGLMNMIYASRLTCLVFYREVTGLSRIKLTRIYQTYLFTCYILSTLHAVSLQRK